MIFTYRSVTVFKNQPLYKSRTIPRKTQCEFRRLSDLISQYADKTWCVPIAQLLDMGTQLHTLEPRRSNRSLTRVTVFRGVSGLKALYQPPLALGASVRTWSIFISTKEK